MMQQFSISDSSQISETRRLIAEMCNRYSFNETETGKVELVVTEMATNLLKHAKGGEILAAIYRDHREPYISILSLDQGPGIKNPGVCLQDGHSTAGSPGTGLGAIKRLSSFFDFYSRPGKGTTFFSRITRKDSSIEPSNLSTKVGVICLPLEGEEACGDSVAIKEYCDRIVLLLVDGLGHGLLAAEAANEAVASFHQHASYGPQKIIEQIHRDLRKTRGAALAIVEIDLGEEDLCFSGIGNIIGRVISFKKSYRMISYHGIVGEEVRKCKEYKYPFFKDDLLIVHSDGLSSRWSRDDYPGLWFKHPTLIAGTLYRDHRRLQDDCSMIVVKREGL